ncbi:protein of unknown function [Enterobacter cancerogenus]|nr:protein of unknown function [Enterobacter cancerogenus]
MTSNYTSIQSCGSTRQDDGKEAEEIIADGAMLADMFIWHAITHAVGNMKDQRPELIEVAR